MRCEPGRLPIDRVSGPLRSSPVVAGAPGHDLIVRSKTIARRFLYVIVLIILIAIAGAFTYRLYGTELMRMALVPTAAFERPAPAGDYRRRAMWLARPDIAGNPALWTPPGYTPAGNPVAAIFFIHPTSYLDRSGWNAPLDDPEANARAALFLRGQASAFNGVGAVWAPRYRQATFGAFLTGRQAARDALDVAYGDVAAAFETFVAESGNRPIILAGHSQGALHLVRLLHDRIAGTPLARRVVAAYVVGWPISRRDDLPEMALPECIGADQPGCILSWQSYAEPADPALVTENYDRSRGLDGHSRAGTAMVCTNPVTGTRDGAAPAMSNLGTLYPTHDFADAGITPGRVPARCDRRGLLLIGAPPELGGYVLPGNNYHVYDYSLFWANVRVDAARRLRAFLAR